MRHPAAARPTTSSGLRPIALGVIAVTSVVIGTLASQSASSSAPSFGEGPSRLAPRALPQSAALSAPSFDEDRRADRSGAPIGDLGALTENDGVLPDGVTVVDLEYPGVAKLDPELLRALHAASKDAAADGVELSINSGWRSRKYQDRLLREAVAKYGSEKEAARWVATADTSSHVSGDAVDIGSVDATAWLSEHGAYYGLCQIYRNEPWHFELRPEAGDRGCPRVYADPRRDPRMQQ